MSDEELARAVYASLQPGVAKALRAMLQDPDQAWIGSARAHEIVRRWREGEKQKDIAASLGISQGRVSGIIQRWRAQTGRPSGEGNSLMWDADGR